MEVMQFIAEEGLLGFTFEGLKRRLGTHPETLSRILDRLEEQQVLEKTERGYQVTQRGREVTGLRQLSALRSEGDPSQDPSSARREPPRSCPAA